MFFLLQALILASLWVTLSAFARLQQPFQSHAPILTSKIDASIESILKSFKSPGGAAVAIVRRSEQGSWDVETKGYGIAKGDRTKVTSETLFAIGSNSKASLALLTLIWPRMFIYQDTQLFATLATGLLISNESLSPQISWNTKIADFVPEWGLMDPVASAESTIVDVMSHRTGLPRHDLIFFPTDTVPDSIRRFRYLRPSTGFREHWQYNNHMYTLLSYFPPLLLEIPFEQYVNDFITEPLGMLSTTYMSEVAEKTGNLADGMMRDGVNQTDDVFGVGRVRPIPYWDPSGKVGNINSGSGGIISNARDMAIWLQTLLNEGRHPGTNETVIPAEAINKVAAGITVSTPVAPFPELSPKVYGGGQMRGTYRGVGEFSFAWGRRNPFDNSLQHGGVVPGFKSQITRIPNENLGVAVLSNDDFFGTQISEAIKFRIIDKALKLEPIDWTARYKSAISKAFSGRTIPTPRPVNATLPSLSLQSLAGKYQDQAYGPIELCLVSQEMDSTSSDTCVRLRAEIPIALPGALDLSIPTLLTRWGGTGVTHLAFSHFERNVFNVSGLCSIATKNSSDNPYWAYALRDPTLVAEFSEDDGLGVAIRGLWGPGEGVPSPSGSTVKERGRGLV
ncbi:Beta-lactamase class penicillin binding protein [Mycena venus]|uniref:Beta-lactamase class penicillin binding protein n=1 Tax=Mycena venus TaxID=2733690 RepID=A0A8H7CSG4_9AGAR|nr:Beta-lactamase class penicillin binding protein [Mycena venus]